MWNVFWIFLLTFEKFGDWVFTHMVVFKLKKFWKHWIFRFLNVFAQYDRGQNPQFLKFSAQYVRGGGFASYTPPKKKKILGNSSDRDIFYIFEATTHPLCVQMVSKCDNMFVLLNRAKTILIVFLFSRNMFVFLLQELSRFVHFSCFCTVSLV